MAYGRTSLRSAAKAPANAVGDLRHRVTLCTGEDIILDGATIVLARREALVVWAAIDEKRGSQWSPQGFAVKEPRDQQSHMITIHHRQEFDITAYAWIYHARMGAPARWFKVLNVSEGRQENSTGTRPRYWQLSCRLVEKSDFAAPPQEKSISPNLNIAAPLPNGIRL